MDREFDDMLERMQSPEHRATVDRLFAMTGEDLGTAAVRVARRMLEERGERKKKHRDEGSEALR